MHYLSVFLNVGTRNNLITASARKSLPQNSSTSLHRIKCSVFLSLYGKSSNDQFINSHFACVLDVESERILCISTTPKYRRYATRISDSEN
jgi:hypothetical protein